MTESIGLRVQGLKMPLQALVLAQLATFRDEQAEFRPRDLSRMFSTVGLPGPSSASNAIAGLQRRGWAAAGSSKGTWQLTPLGRATIAEHFSKIELAALAAETEREHAPFLGQARHTVVPASLAPPSLIPGLQRFLSDHPFETNVFGMTRYPVESDDADPVTAALRISRDVCRESGLQLHLASDRAIDDDLWTNVADHMWGCRFGLAIFEDRAGKGLNYNLTIEVGSMLMTGRRCALLKDTSIARLPTDLVGRIYKSIDLEDPESVRLAVREWIRDDLGFG